ncbi:DUF4279 domain-containing protein [Mucilaginibacter sp. HMF5004]|uniref:DUF4279 domain-containing protein n=1 Tax=Mucilaginibacter rivuli TaxID=2857527 RepID=UPI001C5CF686|nr:DUF4279 domain-containing protein [Mucilaginibacter rivuli]MBW4891305.1 DUF4279 domain-containing protein [Mucilaginibacter rivuli]
MTDEQVGELIYKEFSEKTLGATEQYLEIHSPVYLDGKLEISRIDREGRIGLIVAYLPIEGEHFSFAVYIDSDAREIFNVGIESRNTVSLRATSEILGLTELSSFINLSPTKSHNRGDLKKHGKSAYEYSFVEYEPNRETDAFEDKLRKLLTNLKEHEADVRELALNSNAYINVAVDCHHGNQHIAATIIDLECIRMLSELNLRIEFDFWAWGNPFN